MMSVRFDLVVVGPIKVSRSGMADQPAVLAKIDDRGSGRITREWTPGVGDVPPLVDPGVAEVKQTDRHRADGPVKLANPTSTSSRDDHSPVGIQLWSIGNPDFTAAVEGNQDVIDHRPHDRSV